MSTKAQKTARLKNKEYRDAFVASQISVDIPFQIRALRDQRGWKQSRLASETGMLQPRISAMERPGRTKFTLETLRRIASAFDVALEVRFVPFSELVDNSEKFNPDTFRVPSFDEDFKDAEQERDANLQKAISAFGDTGSQRNNSMYGTPLPPLKVQNRFRRRRGNQINLEETNARRRTRAKFPAERTGQATCGTTAATSACAA